MEFSPIADRLIENNQAYAAAVDPAAVVDEPAHHLAIVACMDARLNLYASLGIHDGEAHIIRNAGGVVTDDVIRSLCLSQRFLGTREIILVHHTDCGMQKTTDTEFNRALEAELGVRPAWSLESFTDPAADVRQSMERLRISPFIAHTDHIRGFVYDVTTGGLDEVQPADRN